MINLRVFAHLLRKDILIEFRGKQFLFASAAFGVLMLVITGIALDATSRLPTDWAAGLLWLSVFFSTTLALSRHDVKDREYGATLGLKLVPADRSIVYYAKWCSTSLFVVLSQSVLVLAFWVIFNQPPPGNIGAFALTFLGGTVGLTGVGTLLAAVTVQSAMRDVLLPMTLFPVAVPLFLAVVKLTEGTLARVPNVSIVWAEVLVGYVIVVAVLPWLLYETLTEV